MEKRNVATTARNKESASADKAIDTAAKCIRQSQDIMKKAVDLALSLREMATRQHEEVKKISSMTKAAMDEDERADRDDSAEVLPADR